ncbi:MAG: helix-turn-helix domain-containing protein [Planctomycetota bacterium]
MSDTYSIPEAAKYLKVSEPTLYRWMKDGTLSYFKVGRRTFFKRENLDALGVQHTSVLEVERKKNLCTHCGHGHMVEGRIQSTGKIYFRPKDTKFLTLKDPNINIEAMVCEACGFMKLVADTAKLKELMPEVSK